MEESQVKQNTEPKQKSDSGQFWKITTVVLIILLAFVALRGGNNAAVPTGGAAGTVPSDGAPSRVEVSMDNDPVLGKKDAPVTIIEFSDYQCPFCGRFYTQTLPLIKSKYIDTGKVKLIFRDFPLSFHPEAMPAAVAANCAGEQGKYYQYHDKIFDNQATMGGNSYKQWAQELGLNVAQWESCLKDPKQTEEVQKDLRDGTAAGVQGTPAFFINGQLISGAQPFSVFEQIIEAELSK